MSAIAFRSVSKTYPDGTPAVRDLDLTVTEGELLCILGPSGCGKSSTLRMLAGLEEISTGEITVDGRRVNDVPARLREMAMVFENYALYPHLDVLHNIAMPLVARHVARSEIERRVRQIADTLHITELLAQRPRTLSGGQRQRVALGRALIRRPRVFLMDEPLGHLEAYLRVELRSEIRRLHEERETTTVYITHDQQEASAISDRIAVMSGGRLQQVGTFLDLLDRPINRFVASFVGEWPINLLPADVVEDAGAPALRVGEQVLPVTTAQARRLAGYAGAGATFALGWRPEDLGIVDAVTPHGLPGRVLLVEPQGATCVVVIDTVVGRINAVVDSAGAPAAGAAIAIRPDQPRVHLFGSEGINLFADTEHADG